jgi:hypothetical protein
VLFSFSLLKCIHYLQKNSNSLYVYIFFSFLFSLISFFSTNKTELYHIHSLIRRLTSIILSMIAGLCCLYTHQMSLNIVTASASSFDRKKRLVTRNHLSFRQKRKRKRNIFYRSISIYV